MFPHCKNAIAQTVALVPFSCLLLNSLTFITPDFLLPAAAEVIKAETKERDRLLQRAKQSLCPGYR